MALGFQDPDKNAPLTQVSAPALQGPTTRQVSSGETVSGQMERILASNSPLLQRARTRAAQAANKRGLLNSSMGVQAGEEAVLTTAMPMAQDDASIYSNQGLANQTVQNQFSRDTNEYIRQRRLNDQSFNQQVGGGNYGAGLIGAELAGKKELLASEQSFTSGENTANRAATASRDALAASNAASESALSRAATVSRDNSSQAATVARDALTRAAIVSQDALAAAAVVTENNARRAQETTTATQRTADAKLAATALDTANKAAAKLEGTLKTELETLGHTNDLALKKLSSSLALDEIDATAYANTRGAYLKSVSEITKQSVISVNAITVLEGVSSEDKAKMLLDQSTLANSVIAAEKVVYEASATWDRGWSALPPATVIPTASTDTAATNIMDQISGYGS